MKTSISIRQCSVFFLLVLCIILAGCFPKRVVWSPDGKQAVVLGDKGLYLCDPDGQLSGMQVPEVSVAAWFPDSRRIALSQRTKYGVWSNLQSRLAPEVRDLVVSEGQAALKVLKAGRDINAVFVATKIPDGPEKNMLGVYLRSLDGMKELAGVNWDFLNAMEVEWTVLQVATVADGKVTLGPPLVGGLRQIFEIRIAPGGTAIAFTTESGVKEDYSLQVVPVDASSPAKLVAEHVAWYHDWSADGHSLVYVKSVVATGGGDQLTLGSLSRRKVLDESGRVVLQEGQDELAGLLFNPFSKVRCLADGRILFSSAELHLPTTTADMPERQQLYVIDPERQATLTRLIPASAQSNIPELVGFFEPSPDGKRVSILGKDGEVVVLTLATGKVDVVQEKPDGSGNNTEFESVPVWRSNTELCFVCVQKTNNVVQPPQVAIWQDGRTRVISQTWPDEVRQKFLDK